MDALIADLIDRYETGGLSRRELIGGLSALAAAGGAGQALAQAPPALKPAAIDHVSILVADLQRSADFYRRVFNLTPVSEDAANKIVRLAPADAPRVAGAPTRVLVSLRQTEPVGTTDHWSFRLAGFDRDQVSATLTGHGLTPVNNVEYGFHVKDPDGIVVQMV